MEQPLRQALQSCQAAPWKTAVATVATYLAYFYSGLTLGVLLDLILFIATQFYWSHTTVYPPQIGPDLRTALICIGVLLPISCSYGFCIQAKRWPLHAICCCFCIVLSNIALALLAGGFVFIYQFYFGVFY